MCINFQDKLDIHDYLYEKNFLVDLVKKVEKTGMGVMILHMRFLDILKSILYQKGTLVDEKSEITFVFGPALYLTNWSSSVVTK